MKAIIVTPDAKMKQVNFYGFYKKMDTSGKWSKWALVGQEDSVYLEFPEMILLPLDYNEHE